MKEQYQRPFPWLYVTVALVLGGILIASLFLAIPRKPSVMPMGLHYTEAQVSMETAPLD